MPPPVPTPPDGPDPAALAAQGADLPRQVQILLSHCRPLFHNDQPLHQVTAQPRPQPADPEDVDGLNAKCIDLRWPAPLPAGQDLYTGVLLEAIPGAALTIVARPPARYGLRLSRPW